jgi:CBS domain containing-hemolysin-like protein
MTKLFGVKDMVRKISYEEVEAFIDMSHEEGEVEADERRQIKNLLSLSETSAETAMTPRVFMEFVSKDMTVTEVCEFFINSSHSRMPVCGLSTDDVDYVITLREAFKLKQE